MANNLIPIWENYDNDHNSFMSDYLEASSVTANMNYKLMKNNSIGINIDFNSDNHNGKVSFVRETNNKVYNKIIIQENGNFEFENKYDYGNLMENLYLSMYLKNNLISNSDERTHNQKLVFTFNLPKANVSLGLDGLNYFNIIDSGVIFINGIYGANIDRENNFYNGISFGFDFKKNYFPFFKILLGFNNTENFRCNMELNCKRKLFEEISHEADNVHTKTKIKALADYKFDNSVSFAGEFTSVHNYEGWKLKYSLASEFKLDEKTIFKSRFNSCGELILSLRHKFNDMINVGLISSINYVPQTTIMPIKLPHLKYKSGAIIEFNEVE